MATTEQLIQQVSRSIGFLQQQLSSIEESIQSGGVDANAIAQAVAAEIQPTEEQQQDAAEPLDVDGLLESIKGIVDGAVDEIEISEQESNPELEQLPNLVGNVQQSQADIGKQLEALDADVERVTEALAKAAETEVDLSPLRDDIAALKTLFSEQGASAQVAISQGNEVQKDEFATLRNLLGQVSAAIPDQDLLLDGQQKVTERLDERADGLARQLGELSLYGRTAHEALQEAISSIQPAKVDLSPLESATQNLSSRIEALQGQVAAIKLPEFPEIQPLDLSPLEESNAAIAANMALLSKAEQSTLGRMEQLLSRLEHGILSTDPEDGLDSLAEQIANLRSKDDSILEELRGLESAPGQTELGLFSESALTTKSFGSGAWARGLISETRIKHPGEFFEFRMSGDGVFGLFVGGEPAKWTHNHGAFFRLSSYQDDKFSILIEDKGVKSNVTYDPSQPVRLTITKVLGATRVEWGAIKDGQIAPISAPISIPDEGLALRLLFGGIGQAQDIRVGKYTLEDSI